VLRTTYADVDGEAVQVVHPAERVPIVRIDLGAGAEDTREARLRSLIGEEASTVFDLSGSGPLRCTLMVLGEAEYALLFTMHHIASDGWSMGVLVNEFVALYAAHLKGDDAWLPALPVQYADYAVWQRGRLAGEALEARLDYWRVQLSGLPTVHGLPLDRPRPAEQRFEGGRVERHLGVEVMSGVQALARSQDASVFMVLQAAFAVLLSRWSGETDIVIGTPVAGRLHPDVEGLIGFFVNTLVLRTDVSGDPTFVELVGRSREAALSAYEHQEVPFELLVEELKPARSLSHTPLFQVMLTLQNNEHSELVLPGLSIEPLSAELQQAKFDLDVSMQERADGLWVSWGYASSLFEASSIERMAEAFVRLLREAVAAPQTRVGTLSLQSPEARAQVLDTFNDTDAPYPSTSTIHGVFEAQARRTPEALALVWETTRVDYGALNRRANAVAARLMDLGVGVEDRVAICADRGIELVVGVLGILKSGAGYVPLDPAYPQSRLSLMLEDSAPKAVLTLGSGHEALSWPSGLPVLGLESLAHEEVEADPRVSGLGAESLAYVIYTSGSTGVPKGVMVEHGNTVNLLTWAHRHYAAEELRTVLFSTSINFDLAVYELLVPLTQGHAVRMVGDALSVDAEMAVTLVNTVPSAMTALVDAGRVPQSVLTVNLAGEPLKRGLVDRIFETTSAHWVANLYGPTETTTYSTWVRMSRQEGFVGHIGRPIANTRVYVLDGRGEPVPVGVPGELWIGGAGVARGYLNRPELTAERFVTDRFASGPGARMYRTGDVCRWLPDGTLAYLGRNDDQVKIRGYRIELGEVESRLSQQPGVRESVVQAQEEAAGQKRLVAYVVLEGTTVSAVREGLGRVLPGYMVPTAYVELSGLPLTPNGKVDRKALLTLEGVTVMTRAYQAPVGAVEQAMAGIWQDLLRAEQIGRDDHFFERGGHSLLHVMLMTRIRQEFLVDLSVRDLFLNPVVSELARMVEALQLEHFLKDDMKTMSDELDSLTEEELIELLKEESLDER
jgi:amino acid adenylation domain-containing protein